MSLGTQALVLIRLDAHAGQPVTVEALCAHYGMSRDVVRESLMALAYMGHATLVQDADQVVLGGQAVACEGQPCS